MSQSLHNTSILAAAMAGLSAPFVKAADAMRSLGPALPQPGSVRNRRGSRSNRTAEKCAEVGHLWRVVNTAYPGSRSKYPIAGVRNTAWCRCARCGQGQLRPVSFRPNNDKLNLRRSDRLRMQKEQARQGRRAAA